MTDADRLREAADALAEYALDNPLDLLGQERRATAALLRAVADECDESLSHYWIANSEPFTLWDERLPAAALALADVILGRQR